MDNKTNIQRFTGCTDWIDPGALTEIHQAIFRPPNELALELRYENRRYSALLQKTGVGQEFRGTFTVDGVRGGDARCTMTLRDDGATLLNGRWKEDGKDYIWWARLDPIDTFDE
jgi:hypothetical protein